MGRNKLAPFISKATQRSTKMVLVKRGRLPIMLMTQGVLCGVLKTSISRVCTCELTCEKNPTGIFDNIRKLEKK